MGVISLWEGDRGGPGLSARERYGTKNWREVAGDTLGSYNSHRFEIAYGA